jgi:hypothetical protein
VDVILPLIASKPFGRSIFYNTVVQYGIVQCSVLWYSILHYSWQRHYRKGPLNFNGAEFLSYPYNWSPLFPFVCALVTLPIPFCIPLKQYLILHLNPSGGKISKIRFTNKYSYGNCMRTKKQSEIFISCFNLPNRLLALHTGNTFAATCSWLQTRHNSLIAGSSCGLCN